MFLLKNLRHHTVGTRGPDSFRIFQFATEQTWLFCYVDPLNILLSTQKDSHNTHVCVQRFD